MPQNTSSPARIAKVILLACIVFALGLPLAHALAAPAPQAQAQGMFNPDAELYTDNVTWLAAPDCTTDADCAQWACDNGFNPDDDPYTKGKAQCDAQDDATTTSTTRDDAQDEGKDASPCADIDWSDKEFTPYDANGDGYIDCTSDIELGA